MIRLFTRPLLYLLLTGVPSLAQRMDYTPTPQPPGHSITLQIKGMENQTLYLAQWQSPRDYLPRDTAQTTAEGYAVFRGGQPLDQGLYLVILPNGKLIEFIADRQQHFRLQTEGTDPVRKMKVSGSTENTLFYEYQQKMIGFFEAAKGADRATTTELAAQSTSFQRDFFARNAFSFTVKLLQAAEEPRLYIPSAAAATRPDSMQRFYRDRAHYWDGFDLNDARLIRTPFFKNRLTRFIQQLTPQHPDSLSRIADWLLARSTNPAMRQQIGGFFVQQYEKPTQLGTEGAFIHVVENYILTRSIPVGDSTSLIRYAGRVSVLKPLQVGKPFPLETLTTPTGKPFTPQTINAPFLVVFLYDPDCAHCREVTPKLKAFANAYKAKGVEVLAIPTTNIGKPWRDYIQTFALQGWHHGYIGGKAVSFYQQYDVDATPVFYVLDQNKTIIARKLPVEKLASFYAFHSAKKR